MGRKEKPILIDSGFCYNIEDKTDKEYLYRLYDNDEVKISCNGFLVGLMEYDKFISHYEVKANAIESELKQS